MWEEEARAVAAACPPELGVVAADWAGGFWGVEMDTPFVTPDGRGAIIVMLGSDDEDNVLVQYGDYGRGQYSDDSVELPLLDTDTAGIVAWLAAEHARFEAGGILPEPFASGMLDIYADAVGD